MSEVVTPALHTPLLSAPLLDWLSMQAWVRQQPTQDAAAVAGGAPGGEAVHASPSALPPLLDWLSAYGRLRQQGSAAQPAGATLTADYHPPWWWGTTPAERASGQAEPIPLGDLADPVSQVAGMLAPGFLRAGRQAVDAVAAQRAMGRRTLRPQGFSFTRNQAGNLGPPPVSPEGVPLPESAVRGEGGELQRLYHGTPRAFDDFDLQYAGGGAGGDLYGPGVYMTNNPSIAAEYAAGKAGTLTGPQLTVDSALARRAVLKTKGLTFSEREAIQELSDTELASTIERMVELGYDIPDGSKMIGYAHGNIRPLYADLKKPFDIHGESLAAAEVQHIEEAAQRILGNAAPTIPHNPELAYKALARRANKETVNHILQEAGYDGITHIGGAVTGGAPHRVYIAFSPEQVYPSFNVDALP